MPEPEAERQALLSLGSDPDGQLLYLSGSAEGYRRLSGILREVADRPLGSVNPGSQEARDTGTQVSSLLSKNSEVWLLECSLVESVPRLEAQEARQNRVRDRAALVGCGLSLFVLAFLLSAMARGLSEFWRETVK
jgi:hypothetical protein